MQKCTSTYLYANKCTCITHIKWVWASAIELVLSNFLWHCILLLHFYISTFLLIVFILSQLLCHLSCGKSWDWHQILSHARKCIAYALHVLTYIFCLRIYYMHAVYLWLTRPPLGITFIHSFKHVCINIFGLTIFVDVDRIFGYIHHNSHIHPNWLLSTQLNESREGEKKNDYIWILWLR